MNAKDPSKEPTAISAILKTAIDAIVTVDETGSIVSANPATETRFGYSVSDLIGKSINVLIPSSFQLGDNRKETGMGHRKDGSTFPLHLAVSEFEVDGQHLSAYIVRDISDRNERQARLEAILNNAVDAIITIDRRGAIDSANPATESLFGYSQEELVGQNVKMLMPNPYREQHDGYLKNYHDTGTKKIIGIGREVIGQRKDGSTFPMHLAVSEIQLADRVLYTGIVRDITDLKAAERKLAELNSDLESRVKQRTEELRKTQADLVRSEKFATLGKVSGGIAHEIRNPLNAVKTSAYYLLNASNASEEKIREHLERIDRQVSLIDNVVTALSDVAKLPEAQLLKTDLKAILKTVIGSTGLPSTIVVENTLADDLPLVLADTNQIVIAFKNLVRNARDAMSEGGTLKIHATESNAEVDLHVEDTGIGIAEEDLGQILEPLYTTKARGMGLGLSITRAIVEKNGGRLRVESELGDGSCFTITLRKVTATD
ncbi:PAS domain S-box protein [Mariniblastus fucicola]|nr:PAS domain S-box protein [Mariniblastus fucicola]